MKMKLRLVAPALLEISLSSQITLTRIYYGACRGGGEGENQLVVSKLALGIALRTTDRLRVIP